ncbi:hypothetical protein BRE01_53830 [Brevibacillus reuszeri]|uniref:Uncharacterized protein n=1 Tax=Brevibacillus reuszeri TaxID=54915 RepID=A0ABQ0TUZ8_9BACL|nr:hypothetical protein BRE01_53830 [Brevibacillus reuszeri]
MHGIAKKLFKKFFEKLSILSSAVRRLNRSTNNHDGKGVEHDSTTKRLYSF